MNLTRVRVLMTPYPPHVFDDCGRHFPRFRPSMQCPFPGWCVEIMMFLVEYLKLEIEPVVIPYASGPRRPDIGSFVNGSWTGAAAYLMNGSADTVCTFYQSTRLRRKYFAFTTPLYTVTPGFVVKKRSSAEFDLGDVWNIFNPYQGATWLTMILMLIVESVVLTLIVKMEWMPRRIRYGEVFWKLLRLQLQQPEIFEFKSTAGYVALSCFALLQCLIVSSLYQSWILSALLRPSTDTPIRDASDLVPLIRSGRLRLVTDTVNSWFYEKLANSHEADYAQLRKATAINPVVRVATVDELLDLVETGKYVVYTQLDGYLLHQTRRRCDLRFVTRGMPERGCHLLFEARSPFVKLFDRAISMNRGFIHRTFQKYFESGFSTLRKPPQCEPSPKGMSYRREPLGFGALSGLHLIFGIGFFVSMLAFVIEQLWPYVRRRVTQTIEQDATTPALRDGQAKADSNCTAKC